MFWLIQGENLLCLYNNSRLILSSEFENIKSLIIYE